MDKNVLDKEEIHDMKIICKSDYRTIFAQLKSGDVFKLLNNKYDDYTYMKIEAVFGEINVIRLDDGQPFAFQQETKVEQYHATLTIERQNI